MADLSALLERRTLTAAVNRIQERPSFLYDRYFKPNTRQVYGENVDFEVYTAARKLARFRFRGQEANVVSKTGYELRTVKMPIVREKKVLSAVELLRENPLESIYNANGGTIEQARNASIARELQDLKNRVARRREWMAAQILTTGAIDYPGDTDGGPAFKIDLGVTAPYMPVHSGASLWTDAASDPLEDLYTYNALVNDLTGMNVKEVILGRDAAKAFRNNVKVKDNLDRNNYAAGRLSLDPAANLLGTYGNVQWYTYSNSFVNDAGSTENFMPANMALFIPDDMRGEALYGVIDEVDTVFAGEYFSKSWVTQDPSERWMLVSSRFLTMLYEPGSWVMATVVT